jgi:hypothetical protein
MILDRLSLLLVIYACLCFGFAHTPLSAMVADRCFQQRPFTHTNTLVVAVSDAGGVTVERRRVCNPESSHSNDAIIKFV